MPVNRPDSDNDSATESVTEIQPTKKNRTKSNSPADPYEIYIAAARTVARCIDLSCDVSDVIKTVQLLQQEEASMLGELDEEDTARKVREECLRRISAEAREHATRTYYKILQIVPDLREFVDTSKGKELMDICSKMKSTINGTRSNDATGIKSRIALYALPDTNKPSSLDPPIIIGAQGRAELGFNHPIIARWLCPADQLEIFDEDPEQACKDLASGKIEMGSLDFPTLFWSGRVPGDDYDPADMCHGLFQSYFLVRIGRHIFLGPSSALGGDSRATRSCNALLHNMLTVEAEHIAYICIQARFALSSKSQWSQLDGNIDYFKMYHGIIEFIQGSPDAEWRDDLLRWWNKAMFGDENGRRLKAKTAQNRSSSESTASARISTAERLNAQMKARLAARRPPLAIDPALRREKTPDWPIDPALRETNPTLGIEPNSGEERASDSGGSFVPARLRPQEQRAPPGSSGGTLPTSNSRPHSPASQPESLRPLTPMTETDGEQDVQLTPIAKRKQTKGVKRGKRPAPVADELGGDQPTVAGRGKRSRRNRT